MYFELLSTLNSTESAMPVNALAPEVTGVNKLIDFVAQRLPAQKFSTNARTFLETAQGKREPITESNFSPEELATLKELIALRGGDEGDIQYRDYQALGKILRERGKLPMSLSPGLGSMYDPIGNIQTTLGRFKYSRDENGNLIAHDTYDFNPPQEGASEEDRLAVNRTSPYGFIRDYAGQKIPPGYGRQVKINLGK
jgi:hypothetical protein